jgi:uncharacterized protein (DUF697 family)
MAQEPIGSGKSEKTDPAMAEETIGSATAEMTDEQRDEFASKLVDRFALWSGAAGLIPVPFVDVAAVGGVQVQMLRRLSQIYSVPFSKNRGKAVIASLAGSMIPATSGLGAASALKGVPVIGTTVAALTMPTLSAGATYAIGKVFIQHFRSDGTLLDFKPPDYREFIKAQRQTWGTRSAAARSAAQSTAARSGSTQGLGTST